MPLSETLDCERSVASAWAWNDELWMPAPAILELIPDRFISGELVWPVTRLPDASVYAHMSLESKNGALDATTPGFADATWFIRASPNEKRRCCAPHSVIFAPGRWTSRSATGSLTARGST